jgi:ABC-type cobalamin transport system permease subunit
VGFNPFRTQKRRTSDLLVVGVALVVIVALVVWGIFG